MSNQTPFDKVTEFCQTFGHPVKTVLERDIFDTDPKLVSFRMDLIREEMKELEDAVADKDMTETVDALADLIYVIHGMCLSIGCNMNQAFDLVHASNMSKVCSSEDEAINTVNWYKTEFEEGRLTYDTPAYRKADSGEYWIIFNESSGKILKSINYKPVKFDSLP